MIEYGSAEDLCWHDRFDEARFTVRRDGEHVNCRITLECIEDNIGQEDDPLSAAKKAFDAITDKIGHKIARGIFESDGSVLLRSADWMQF